MSVSSDEVTLIRNLKLTRWSGNWLQSIRIRLNRWGSLLIGLSLVLGICLVALLGPVISPLDPYKTDLAHRFAPIGTEGHWLGTDDLGRDLLAQLMWGARSSVAISFVPVIVAVGCGLVLGGLAGYTRGIVEGAIMRSVDVFFALPPIILAIALAATLGPGLWNVVIALTIVLIPPMTRVVYQQVVTIREMLFVQAAQTLGATDTRIISRHILPNAMSAVLAYGASVAGLSIVLGAGLSFIGLGVQPPDPDWGRTINAGRAALTKAPHVATLPGLGIFLLSLGFNLIADGIRDITDPYSTK